MSVHRGDCSSIPCQNNRVLHWNKGKSQLNEGTINVDY